MLELTNTTTRRTIRVHLRTPEWVLAALPQLTIRPDERAQVKLTAAMELAPRGGSLHGAIDTALRGLDPAASRGARLRLALDHVLAPLPYLADHGDGSLRTFIWRLAVGAQHGRSANRPCATDEHATPCYLHSVPNFQPHRFVTTSILPLPTYTIPTYRTMQPITIPDPDDSEPLVLLLPTRASLFSTVISQMQATTQARATSIAKFAATLDAGEGSAATPQPDTPQPVPTPNRIPEIPTPSP